MYVFNHREQDTVYEKTMKKLFKMMSQCLTGVVLSAIIAVLAYAVISPTACAIMLFVALFFACAFLLIGAWIGITYWLSFHKELKTT